MSRVVICLFLLFFINSAAGVSNSTDDDLKNNTMQTMQKLEDDARRQWELSVRKEPEVEHSEPSSSETIELYTWFPWFQENRPTIHTIKALAAITKENTSSFPVVIGVGTWREITLYGKKKDTNFTEKPDASPLHNGSVNVTTLRWLDIVTILFVYLLVL